MDRFHLLTGEDGEPIAIAFGPSRHDSKVVASFYSSNPAYKLSDRERGSLAELLVNSANNNIQP